MPYYDMFFALKLLSLGYKDVELLCDLTPSEDEDGKTQDVKANHEIPSFAAQIIIA